MFECFFLYASGKPPDNLLVPSSRRAFLGKVKKMPSRTPSRIHAAKLYAFMAPGARNFGQHNVLGVEGSIGIPIFCFHPYIILYIYIYIHTNFNVLLLALVGTRSFLLVKMYRSQRCSKRTLLGTNISPTKALLKLIVLFYRWEVLYNSLDSKRNPSVIWSQIILV